VENVNTVKENTETLLANRDVGLEINAEKIKYMIMFHHQNSGQREEYRLWRNCIMMNFIACTLHLILLG
jgi:hypothetical protein